MLDPMAAMTAASALATAAALGKAAAATGELVRLRNRSPLGEAFENALTRSDDADLPPEMKALLDKLD